MEIELMLELLPFVVSLIYSQRKTCLLWFSMQKNASYFIFRTHVLICFLFPLYFASIFIRLKKFEYYTKVLKIIFNVLRWKVS